jgi:hypothetical protein
LLSHDMLSRRQQVLISMFGTMIVPIPVLMKSLLSLHSPAIESLKGVQAM